MIISFLMKIQQIIDFLEEFSPLAYSESFDNTGLLVGDAQKELTGVLITLDTLEEVVDEAIRKNCNLIVSFHPIIFSPIKKITPKTYVERVILKAIANDISIFAIHTALDNSFFGVNRKICDILGLKNLKILIPQTKIIQKLVTFVPKSHENQVREALFKAGAGKIGKYSECSFSLNGKGSFKANEDAEPFVGEKNKLHFEEETQIGVIFEKHLQSKILNALFETHPYEEVAFEVYTLENQHQNIGLGMTGEFEKEISEEEFLELVKNQFSVPCIRHSKFLQQKIKKIAVLGGSGAFAIDNAKSAHCQAFISSDFKYHDFFKAENKILLTDIGHFESEQFTKNLLFDEISKKFPNFAVFLSQERTNPVFYKI